MIIIVLLIIVITYYKWMTTYSKYLKSNTPSMVCPSWAEILTGQPETSSGREELLWEWIDD